MSNVFGKNIKLSIFGESHGAAIGIIIDGLPAGFNLDIKYIKREMARRAPGQSNITTSRKEKDNFKILSGYFEGKITGSPLCAIIENTNCKSKDYTKIKDLMRPGHADFTAFTKYYGFNDYRGGGYFSGRLTAPLVFAGAIAKQILGKQNILIASHIKSIGEIEEQNFNYVDISEELLKKLVNQDFPTLNQEKGKKMINSIVKVKEQMDSIGGVVETAAINIPVGVGSPFFDSVESTIAHLLFSVPAVKGVEFGEGFGITKLKGSSSNDEMYVENDKVKCYTNNNGGIIGGITNGMPLIFRTAIKPTPSIGKCQRTVNVNKLEKSTIKIEGRHDPCIITRAVPVIEAVAALSILDLMKER